MARRETGGIYKRGGVYWVNYRVEGERYHESTSTADRREAQSFLARVRRQIREGTWTPPTNRAAEREAERLRARLAELESNGRARAAAALTVAEYAEQWLERRRAAEVRTVHDEEVRLRSWVLPRIGDKPLAEVKRSDVRDLIAEMQRTPSPTTGRPYAPRSVLHVYGVTRLLFADALADELIAATPCTLRTRKGELPVKKDADPRWRGQAVYTREEAEQLISDERIPEDRRVFYALQILAGMRAGEASARRWRDIDSAAQPLGRMTIWSQAVNGDERETKQGDVREVPIVPTLATVLAAWKLRGFAMWFGRNPKPDDLIVPSRHDGRSPRSKTSLLRLKVDLERLGLRTEGRGRHAMRATFLTLLESDGANMAIARRATHAAPSDVVAGYVRTSWADLCREIGKLRLELRRGAVVIPLRRAQNDDAPRGDSRGDSGSEGGVFVCEKSGTDGTRTRGLRRDRPAL